MLFQTTFEKKLVAETSKERVFLLPQRKIRCATTSFFGVGGSGRRPLELGVCPSVYFLVGPDHARRVFLKCGRSGPRGSSTRNSDL